MNAVPVKFDPVLHEYRVAGERWPSVTQVIDMLGELDGIPRSMLDAAAKFGTAVHEACHLDNLGALDWKSLDTHLMPYVQAWRRAQNDLRIVVTASEQMVANVRLRYCGTLDVRGRTAGVRELIDIKSSADIPRTVGPQTWAYADAIDEERIRRRVVQLRADGTYRTERLTDSRDRSNFISALNVLNWRLAR